MRNKLAVIFMLLIVPVLVGGCFDAANGERRITVSAAASMKDVLGEIKEQFEMANPGIKVSCNFGSSGILQKQIERGAPVDVFISAGKKQMSALEDNDFVGKARIIAGNELIVVAPEGKGLSLRTLEELTGEKFTTIAIGTPETVPAGKYAEEALEKSGVMGRIRSKLVPVKDARQVLTYVETGVADAGLVYMTDARISKNVHIVYQVPEDLHSPIVYPAASVKLSPYREEAEMFLGFLGSRTAKQIFKKHGFTVP